MNSQDAERLISQYLFDPAEMSSEEISQLTAWISQDPSHARHYQTCTSFHSAVRSYYGLNDVATRAVLEKGSPELCPAMSYDELVALLRMEASSPSLNTEKPRPDQERRPHVTVARQKPSRFWLSVAMTSLAAVVPMVVWVSMVAPRHVAVATLRDCLVAQWVDTDTGFSEGTRFLNDGLPLRLAKGLAKISFDHGAEVVLEGPSEIKVYGANHVALSYGKLCMRAPQAAKGFRVDVPRYSVVDLGTEYGIEVGVDGATNVLMYEGKASIVPQAANSAEPTSLVTEGQARHLTMDGPVQTTEIGLNAFVRAFNRHSGRLWRGEPVDLADVVGGGDGFGSGLLQYGVSLPSGLIAPATFGSHKASPAGYVRVMGSSFIDGVLLPGRNESSTQISSGGTLWTGCPRTSSKVLAGPCNGGYIGAGDGQLTLNGVRYGSRAHPSMLLPSNVGITFDLRSMRTFCQQMYGVTPSHFRALAGLPDGILTQGGSQSRIPPVADFWVLVDGQERNKVRLAGGADPVHVDIPLTGDAEFLTLAVTRSADPSPDSDVVILGNPVLTLSRE